MQRIGNQKSIRTCVPATEDARVLTLEIQTISTVYELDTGLALSNEIRVYGTDF
jgi:hypothetical protein